MRKLLRNITAVWLAAFAIAGATVWSVGEEKASAATGRDVPPAHREAAD